MPRSSTSYTSGNSGGKISHTPEAEKKRTETKQITTHQKQEQREMKPCI